MYPKSSTDAVLLVASLAVELAAVALWLRREFVSRPLSIARGAR